MTDSERRLLMATAALALAPDNTVQADRVVKLRNGAVAERLVSDPPAVLEDRGRPAGEGLPLAYFYADRTKVAVRAAGCVEFTSFGSVFSYSFEEARALRDSLNRILGT